MEALIFHRNITKPFALQTDVMVQSRKFVQF